MIYICFFESLRPTETQRPRDPKIQLCSRINNKICKHLGVCLGVKCLMTQSDNEKTGSRVAAVLIVRAEQTASNCDHLSTMS